VKKTHPIVLVCEDEPLVRTMIVDYLIDHNCRVIEAGSGEDAVGLINGPDQQLDVLFTDIRLGWGSKRLGCRQDLPRPLPQRSRPLRLRLFNRTTAGCGGK
jgi:CheY-like chemotaxis protein